MKIRKDCSNRSQDKDLERSAVTWVSVKTKTRSKNSSREVTRSSASIFGFLCALVFFAIHQVYCTSMKSPLWVVYGSSGFCKYHFKVQLPVRAVAGSLPVARHGITANRADKA